MSSFTGGFRPAPTGLHGDTVWSLTPAFFTVAAAAMGACGLVYCFYEWRRKGDSIALLLWLGGFGGAFVAEPMLGHLGHLWWPTDYPGPSFTAFGAHIPGMIPPIYSFYLGMLGFVSYRILDTRPSARLIWTTWAILAGSDFALQIVAISLKAYFYYGRQPFDLIGLPLVGPVKNGTAYLVIGFLTWLCASRLRGGNRLLVAFVPLTGYLAAAITTAWPWYLAINIDVSRPLEWLIATLTFVLCLIAVRGIVGVVAHTDSPLPSPDAVAR